MTKPSKNRFDLSHDVKLSCNMGQLVPIMCTECVPGDKFNISADVLVRLAPLVSPMMHRVNVHLHYFFVPNRITWKNWEKFITNRGVGVPAFPFVNLKASNYTKLHDYMGIPNPIDTKEEDVSALPFAAYQMIYQEFYRDQNLVPDVDFALEDADNTSNLDLHVLRNRAWEHDYFTAALPFAQKGGSIDVPLGNIVSKNEPGDPWIVRDVITNDPITGALSGNIPDGVLEAGTTEARLDPNGQLEIEPTTINDLRTAYRLQEWLEKNARAGTRYVESILAHFGVRSSDKRLQRPEYITGTKSPIVISEVLNTTGTDDLPQGNMAGHGISVNSGKSGSYFCEEHGYIIGIMSVLPRTAYQQGIAKHFLKTNDMLEYYYPSFAHLGEQAVLGKELYAFNGGPGNLTWGYVPRYAEYKYEPNRVAGDFRTTLDFWHMGRIFDSAPSLNESFITSDPTTRVFAVEDPAVDKLYCHVLNKISAVRPMPKFGTPSM